MSRGSMRADDMSEPAGTYSDLVMTEYVYEIVDSTSDEMYFTAGIYTDLERAVDEVMSGEPDTLSDVDHEDYIKIEIRKRKLNELTDHVGEVVRVFEWIREYEEGGTRWEAI